MNKVFLFFIFIIHSCKLVVDDDKLKEISLDQGLNYIFQNYDLKDSEKVLCDSLNFWGDSTYLVTNFFKTEHPFKLRLNYKSCSDQFFSNFSDNGLALLKKESKKKKLIKQYKTEYEIINDGKKVKASFQVQEVEIDFMLSNTNYKKIVQINSIDCGFYFVGIFLFTD